MLQALEMSRARLAHEKRVDRLARPERRFHQADSFNSHNSALAMFARESGSESLEPLVLAAGNHCGVCVSGGWSLGCACWMGHAHQPNKPLRKGKGEAVRDLQKTFVNLAP